MLFSWCFEPVKESTWNPGICSLFFHFSFSRRLKKKKEKNQKDSKKCPCRWFFCHPPEHLKEIILGSLFAANERCWLLEDPCAADQAPTAQKSVSTRSVQTCTWRNGTAVSSITFSKILIKKSKGITCNVKNSFTIAFYLTGAAGGLYCPFYFFFVENHPTLQFILFKIIQN